MSTILTIDFHGDSLLVIRDDDRDLVPLRPLVTGMGLDWSAQRKRVMRHPILGRAVAVMATTASPAGDKEGICLSLDLVPGFLFGIAAERIADEALRAKVIAYQRECFGVLADACLGRQRPAPEPRPTSAVPTELALRMVAEARQSFDRYVGREVWFATGLLVTPGMRTAPYQGSLFTYSAERRP